MTQKEAIDDAITRLMQICDGSNWPDYAQSGVGFRAYEEITEQLHELIADLQGVRQ